MGNNAIIEINGVIGLDQFSESADDIGTTLQDVKRQFNTYINPSSITVYVNSIGGSMDVGRNIHDFIRAQGLPVTTIGSTVYSIATVILLAGDKDKRFMRPNGRFLIHNPMPAWGIQTDAEGYRELAAVLESEENELINFYANKTTLEPNAIRNLMREDKAVTASQAIELGFVSGIKEVDNQTQDNNIQPLQAKYIPSNKFIELRETLINKHKSEIMKDTEQKNLLQNLAGSLRGLLNQTEPVETKVEETPETPSLEERFKAMEAEMAEMKAAKLVASTESEAKATQLTELVAQKTTELEAKDTQIKSVLTQIEKIEAQPVITNAAPTGAIPEKAKVNSWVPVELVNMFVHKLKA